MAYVLTVTVPRETQPDNPISDFIEIPPLKLEKIMLTFPAGCSGLVGARFKYQTRVLIPFNPEKWIIANDYTIEITPELDLLEPPHKFYLEAYNLDEAYPHTLYCLLDVQLKASNEELILAGLAHLTGVLPSTGRS